jgi:hypothetical protein
VSRIREANLQESTESDGEQSCAADANVMLFSGADFIDGEMPFYFPTQTISEFKQIALVILGQELEDLGGEEWRHSFALKRSI